MHDLGTFAGQLGPAGIGRGILLEAADALPSEIEIDLRELAFGGVLDWVGIIAERDALFAFEQGLPPDGEEPFVRSDFSGSDFLASLVIANSLRDHR